MDTSFKLEQSINQYLAELNTSNALTYSDTQEIKTHLYDTVENLQQKDLTAEEAFAIATLRLGKADVVSKEYKKVNGLNLVNKEWILVFVGVGLTILVNFLIRLYNTGITNLVVQNKISKQVGVGLITLIFLILPLLSYICFKKQESIMQFLKQRILGHQSIVSTIFAVAAGWVCLIEFPASFVNINTFIRIVYYNPITEFIIRSSIPITVTLAILFSTQFVNKKISFSKFFVSQHYWYSFFLGVATEVFAASSRMFARFNILVPSIIFGIVYFFGFYCFLRSNPQKNLAHFLAFLLLGVYVECSIGYFHLTLVGNLGKINSPFSIALIAAVLLAILLHKFKIKQAQHNLSSKT